MRRPLPHVMSLPISGDASLRETYVHNSATHCREAVDMLVKQAQIKSVSATKQTTKRRISEDDHSERIPNRFMSKRESRVSQYSKKTSVRSFVVSDAKDELDDETYQVYIDSQRPAPAVFTNFVKH